MIKADTLIDSLVRLGKAFGQPLDEDVMEMYLLALSDLSPEQLTNGFKRAVRESKFWPRPAEMRELSTGVTAQSTATTKAANYWSWIIQWAPIFLQGHRHTITGGGITDELWAKSTDDLSYFQYQKDAAEGHLEKAQENLTQYQADPAKNSQWSEEDYTRQLDFCTRVDRFLTEVVDKAPDDSEFPAYPPAYLAEALTTMEGFIAESKQLPKIVNRYYDDYFGTKLGGPQFAFDYYYMANPRVSIKSCCKPVLSADLAQYRKSFLLRLISHSPKSKNHTQFCADLGGQVKPWAAEAAFQIFNFRDVGKIREWARRGEV